MGKAEEKRLAKVLGLVVLVTITIVIVVFIRSAYEVADPNPPSTSEEERIEWYEVLDNQDFVIDKGSKDVGLIEFFNCPVSALEFGSYDEAEGTMPCLITTEDAFTYTGHVSMGPESLICTVDGAVLQLWYTETVEGEHPTVTLRGEEERLLFTPRQV